MAGPERTSAIGPGDQVNEGRTARPGSGLAQKFGVLEDEGRAGEGGAHSWSIPPLARSVSRNI